MMKASKFVGWWTEKQDDAVFSPKANLRFSEQGCLVPCLSCGWLPETMFISTELNFTTTPIKYNRVEEKYFVNFQGV